MEMTHGAIASGCHLSINACDLERKLLKPNGVLVVTVDEHEVHHLGCLLEQVFPEAYRQMVTIVINEKGVPQERFSRAEEYAIFNFFGDAGVDPQTDDLLSVDRRESKHFRKPRWERLLRGGPGSKRSESPKPFYPIFIDPATKAIKGVGDALPLGEDPKLTNDKTVAWPIRKEDGEPVATR